MKRLIDAFNEALSQNRSNTKVLLENMAGGGRRLGSTWEELQAMLAGIEDQARVGVCLDTAHTWGQDIPSPMRLMSGRLWPILTA